ncbi:MAG: HD domain-containing protein [Atribacterota bacterium]|nr:HD domain-containing protein [Atribacterota bacterium]
MNINSVQAIDETISYVQDYFQCESTGHDWWHTYRVWKLAKKIARIENADLFVVEISALLHDVGDYKFFEGDEKKGREKIQNFLKTLNLSRTIVEKIIFICSNISYMKTLSKNNNTDIKEKTIEFMVVSDADKLDAMGAIGIARTFTYGGYYHRPIYDPDIPLNSDISQEEYIITQAPSINHFYEKLLKLKDMMYTDYGKKIAIERHNFLMVYLEKFFSEWEGEK